MMRLYSTSLLLLILCFSTVSAEVNIKKHFVFSDKEKAAVFAEQQDKIGNKTSIVTQKKPKKHYIILLKGYKQWTSAFKQAQLLMQQGFSDVEVVKGRFERDYSVFVSRYSDKKNTGKAFNRLKQMGLKNIKVHTNSISKYRYVVTVYTKAQVTKSKIEPVSKIPEAVSAPEQEETMIIVMSDSSDMTYEIVVDDSEIDVDSDDKLDWGAGFRIEEGLFTRDRQDANHTESVYGDAYLQKQINNQWEFKLSARVDGTYQHGKHGTDYSDTDLDYGDSYLRYRNEDYRITLGAQTIRWGRVDNMGPLDNMATLDLSRGVLLKWGENYRSSPAIRVENFLDQAKLDFVYLPKFREAELSNKEDVWYPFDFRNGRMLGYKSTPLMNTLVKNARIDDDISGDGGFGLRYSTIVQSVDVGMTVQRVRLSAPYYRLNETIRQALQTNPGSAFVAGGNSTYTFKEEHPRNWVIGADAAIDWGAVTWRMEAGWFSDMPATTNNLAYKTYKGFQWAGSAEFYPGDANTRVNLQLSGRHINEKEKILDLDNVVALSGEVESLFANDRWKLSGRFNVGLSNKDYLIAPEVAYLGWEPLEIYSAYHYMDGAEQTVGDFYQGNNMLTFGIRASY